MSFCLSFSGLLGPGVLTRGVFITSRTQKTAEHSAECLQKVLETCKIIVNQMDLRQNLSSASAGP